MDLKISFIVFISIFGKSTSYFKLLSHSSQNWTNSVDQETANRIKRQAFTNPSGFLIPNAILKTPVLINIGFYPGNDEKFDNCQRDEVVVAPGYTCQKLLQRGSCKLDEVVLLDPEYRTGYCAPRLCPPDRVFVHGSQQCHVPRDDKICSEGKELFYTSFGTAICDCPDGTVQRSDGLHGEVCVPILRENQYCSKGQVQWFKDYRTQSECLPDPCHGTNLNGRLNSFPVAPDALGKQCFQLGQDEGICQSGMVFALHLSSLKGQCSSLQSLGYEVFTDRDTFALGQHYGVRIGNKRDPPNSIKQTAIIRIGAINNGYQSNSILTGKIPRLSHDHNSNFISKFLNSLGFQDPQILNPILPVTGSIRESPPYPRNYRSTDTNENNEQDSSFKHSENIESFLKKETNSNDQLLIRKKRQDSPTTAMPTKLVNCKPGAQRDVNGKCKETTLGATSGSGGGSSTSSTPSCPAGQSYNLQRMCVSGSSAQSSFG